MHDLETWPQLARPGGVILYSLSKPAYEEYGFREKIFDLDAAQRCN